MTRWLSAAALATMIASPVQAIEWPWQEEREVRFGYCKGFVVAGLAEFPVEELSRTNLWLAWNEVNREELSPGAITPEDYDAGRNEFDSLLAGGSREQLLGIADGDCALGRN
ncbi:MAG: hypothetical protein ABJK20_09870 [Halieaceae bacterium]